MNLPSIAVLLFDEVELLDFAGPLEVFYRAQVTGKNKLFNVFTFSFESSEITTEGGLRVLPDRILSQNDHIEYLLIPGGPGARKMNKESQDVINIKRKLEKKQISKILTVCTGSFIAALTDQFNGKRMTTHFSRYELFKQKFKNVILEEGKRIVDEGNIISAGGITSGIDLALYFIGQEFGKDIVQETANVLEYKFDYSSGTSILSSSGDVSK